MPSHFSVFNKKSLPQNRRATNSGFGMIELLISISVMAIISAIIMTRQDSFNGSLLLRNEVYDIALTAREVQFSAVSASNDSSATFRTRRGLQFSTGDDGFTIFSDTTPNGWPVVTEHYGIQGNIDPRFVIRDVRAVGGPNVSQVSVVFERPNFDGHFYIDDISGEQNNISSIEIDIARVGETGTGVNIVRTLEITSTGQIAVQ